MMHSFIRAMLIGVLAVGLAFAADPPQQQIVVSYNQDTPSSVLEDAKKAILEAVSQVPQ
jgi:hypothetical protein